MAESIVDIKVNERQLQEIEVMLREVPNGVPQVLARAINKVGVAARTQVLRMVTGELNLKQKDIRQRNIFLRKASFKKLFALLSITGRRVPLLHFGARQTRRGVSYAIRRGQRRVLEDAFKESHGKPIRMPKGGHMGVFMRTGDERIGSRLKAGIVKRRGRRRRLKGYLSRPRLPITERYGPSVPEAVRTAGEFASGKFTELMASRLARETEVQVGLVLERHRREAGLVPI